MLMTLAGNGGGKGESAIINNLLTYPGSVFVNDTKGTECRSDGTGPARDGAGRVRAGPVRQRNRASQSPGRP